MLIFLIVLGLLLAVVMINAQNNKYKSTGKESDKVGLGTVLFWLVVGLIFTFGCFGNIIGACGGDLSRIGGQ